MYRFFEVVLAAQLKRTNGGETVAANVWHFLGPRRGPIYSV